MKQKHWIGRATMLATGLLAAGLVAGLCAAQTILPQIADGGNWTTAV